MAGRDCPIEYSVGQQRKNQYVDVQLTSTSKVRLGYHLVESVPRFCFDSPLSGFIEPFGTCTLRGVFEEREQKFMLLYRTAKESQSDPIEFWKSLKDARDLILTIPAPPFALPFGDPAGQLKRAEASREASQANIQRTLGESMGLLHQLTKAVAFAEARETKELVIQNLNDRSVLFVAKVESTRCNHLYRFLDQFQFFNSATLSFLVQATAMPADCSASPVHDEVLVVAYGVVPRAQKSTPRETFESIARDQELRLFSRRFIVYVSFAPRRLFPALGAPIPIATANAEFGVQILRAVMQKADNRSALVSPVTLSLQLGTLLFGSQSETQEQIKGVAFAGVSLPDIKDGLSYSQTLFSDNTVQSITRSFVSGTILSEFKELVEQQFFKFRCFEVRIIDSATAFNYFPCKQYIDIGQKEKILSELNGLICMIGDLRFGDQSINRLNFGISIFSATHYRCFLGNIIKRFDSKMDDFESLPKEMTPVRMNHFIGKFYYCQNVIAKVVGLPCQNDNFVLFLFLPALGLENLECHLTGKELLKLVDMSQIYCVEVTMPEMNLVKKIDLKTHLEYLGVKNAFQPVGNFKGLTSVEGLFVSDFMHLTSVEVALESVNSEVDCDRLRHFTFNANQTFFYALVHKLSRSLLVLGKFDNL